MLNLEFITSQMRRIAIENGAFLREERLAFSRDRVEVKGFHDYVSYVDKESERRLVAKLSELLPQAGFVAEEGSAGFSGEEYCWVIDPLDGTTNFIHNIAPYCVSIALRNREELLAGVVYEVCRNECFWAWKGSKAYLDGKEIGVSPIDNIDNAFIALGFPYNYEHYKPTAKKLVERLYGNASGMRLLGAAAAELCYVAAGRFEARIEADLGPWDIAAGTLILQQAGGRVTDFSGTDSFYSGKEVLASNGKMHQTLLEVLK